MNYTPILSKFINYTWSNNILHFSKPEYAHLHIYIFILNVGLKVVILDIKAVYICDQY